METNLFVTDTYIPNSKDLAIALNPILSQMGRLSSSCPTLNEANQDMDLLGGSLGSSPVHQNSNRKGSGELLLNLF